MSQASATRITDLHEICIARLRDCLDPQSGLFARQIRHGQWAPTLGTESITSSAICLIGIDRAGIPLREVVADPAGLCTRLAARAGEVRYPGGLGLVLWAGSALRAASPLALLAKAGLDAAGLEHVIPSLTTMEVAWMVSGLLHAEEPALRSARTRALRELESRLVQPTLVFRHASTAAPWRHRLRGRIANFADQVYPLQAFAFAATVLGGQDRRVLADRCGARLVAAQGPLGQWWWHHDAVTGKVVESYPVYSVHQHSMAPMALRALALAGGQDHAAAAARSRAWLHANELCIDMVEPTNGIIWRSIKRDESRIGQQLRHGRILLAKPPSAEANPRFTLNREIRPYEWGWLLYATALENGPIPPGHIA
ncbi:hypothetical protein [Belnapia moabensis]|uniref:hypothetical protein n=1 Tax=Belnapia moabensis TaxID=365533 RepID=UPI0006948639|nr:hypothetical protein [Belnapia moabensis]